MARPFISWTSVYEKEMYWLRDLLERLGFETPIVLGLGGSPQPAAKEVNEQLERSDCLFGLVAASRNSPLPNAMAPWIHHELTGAIVLKKPIGVLVDEPIEMPESMRQAFTWQTVNLKDAASLLRATPAFVELALKIKRLAEQEHSEVRHPSILDEVHCVHEIARDRWRQLRAIALTAGPGFSSTCEHTVDVGLDHTPGLSVKLANPATDLKVTSKDRPNSKVTLLSNEDAEVQYKIEFDPPVLPTETIHYRHESIHPNIFPLTMAELRRRAALPGNPPFMREGLFGDCWSVVRRIDKLILEVRAHTDLGLADPQLRVFGVEHTCDEVEEARARIGSPKVAPSLWDVRRDDATECWSCRVTIERPVIGWSYCLLVRPTLAG